MCMYRWCPCDQRQVQVVAAKPLHCKHCLYFSRSKDEGTGAVKALAAPAVMKGERAECRLAGGRNASKLFTGEVMLLVLLLVLMTLFGVLLEFVLALLPMRLSMLKPERTGAAVVPADMRLLNAWLCKLCAADVVRDRGTGGGSGET